LLPADAAKPSFIGRDPASEAGYVVPPMGSPTLATDSASADEPSGSGSTGSAGSAGGADAPGGSGSSGSSEGRTGLGDLALLAITAAVTLPALWLGYGTDLDVADVRAAGDLIRHGDYHPSRNPGVPVFETIVGLLDPVGGHVAINLATAGAAAATVVGIARLIRAWGRDNGDLIALAFLASPITLIAATSTTDFIWAIAFFVWAALAHVRDRSVFAGLLFALAVGSRSSSVVLIAAFLLADAWAPGRRVRALKTVAVMVPAAAALYVPAWLAFDRTFGFLTSTENWRGLGNNLGRFAYKNYAVAGVALILVALVALPALVRSLRNWGRDPLLRFAVLGFAVTEALFFQLPWKPAHLLPSLLMFVLWVAASERNRRPFLLLLIGAVALNGVVAFRPLAPDDPDASTTASFEPAVTVGLLVNDVDCRVEFMDEQPHIHSGSWECTLEPMRGSSADDPTPIPER
jgi:hypothetical protein